MPALCETSAVGPELDLLKQVNKVRTPLGIKSGQS